MERLTYKFPTLTLANFAANAVRKDGVGNVVNAQNGFVTVETTNAAAVKAIAESVRGYEVLREAVAAPAGLPARPVSDVTARLVTHKVPMAFIKQYPSLKKKKQASPGSKIMWSKDDNDLDVIVAKDVPSYVKNGWVIIEKFNEETMEVEVLDLTEKVKLTPDQLKKIRPGIKKDTKKEEIEEEEEEEIIVTEQFGTDGTFGTARFDGENTTVPVFFVTLNHKQYAAYGAKENAGSWTLHPVLNTEDKNLVIAKEAIAQDISAKNLFNRLYSGLIGLREGVEISEAFIRRQQWATMRTKVTRGTPVNITLKSGKTVSGDILRMDKYDLGTANQGYMLWVRTSGGNVRVDDVDVKSVYWDNDPKTKMSEEVEQVDEAKPLVGGQKKLDANKNGKLDAHDFKLLRAKKAAKEETEVNEAMNNYIAFYNRKKMPVQAETSYKAQLKAAEMLKVPASKRYMITVKLATNEEVENIDELTVPQTHALTIARKTVKMNDVMAKVMGGMSKKDAHEFLLKNGTEAEKAAAKKFLGMKEEAEINEAAPAIKAGMRLYAKQDKKTDNGSVVKGQYYKVADAGNGLFNLIHQATGYRKAMIKVTASAIQAMIQNKVF